MPDGQAAPQVASTSTPSFVIQKSLVPVDFLRGLWMVPLADLEIPEEEYQRGVEEKHKPKNDLFFLHWDWRLYDPIKVYPASGQKFHVMNGGRRVRTARMKGFETLPAALCALTEYDASVLFGEQDRVVIPITNYDQFKAALYRGEPITVAIDATLRRHGYEASPSNRANGKNVAAIQGLYSVEKRYGIEQLDDSLALIRKVWASDNKSNDGAFITGMSHFLHFYGDKITPEAEERLRGRPVGNILLEAEGHQQSTRLTKVAATLREVSGIRKRSKVSF